RHAMTTLAAVLAAGLLAAADEPATKPPYQQLLQGEDARLAADLEQRIDQLLEADQYAAAIQAADDLLALRRRTQGPDHDQAVNARWGLDTLRRVAAVRAERRAAFLATVRGGREANRLEAQGRYAPARPLRQRLLDLRRQALGEDHPDTATSCNNLARNLYSQ